MARLFMDTGYALALAVSRDQYHKRAEELAAEYDRPETRFVTTQAILLEIGNGLSALAVRQDALELIDGMRNDPRVTIVSTDDDLVVRGIELFRARPDKEWSLTDCISFLVMKDFRLTLALTADEHFEQAGFRALMSE